MTLQAQSHELFFHHLHSQQASNGKGKSLSVHQVLLLQSPLQILLYCGPCCRDQCELFVSVEQRLRKILLRVVELNFRWFRRYSTIMHGQTSIQCELRGKLLSIFRGLS